MTRFNVQHWRAEHWWLALLAAALLILALAGAVYVVHKHQLATRTMADAAPRVARLNGLAQGGEALQQAQQRLRANLEQFVWGSAQGAAAVGNTALQRVREQAAQHELRVSSSQSIVAPQGEAGFERINLDVRVEGEWPALLALLDDIARLRPVVYLDSAQISPAGRINADGVQPQVAARLGLFVLQYTP
ncbi:MAG: hypothetical protein IKH84_01210 [Ottowia sp.]|nr:hypothetical protein [Ottowia sp.]